MKFIKTFCLLSLLTFFSCGKAEKSIVDCFGESILVDVHHKAAADAASKIDFNVSYGGDHKMDTAIKWDFGDGTIQTLNGLTASHTYSKAGTYTVIAKVGLNNGGCSFDIKETVTIP
ncbi:MAG: PKD domain-containing protein [Sphingobacterium sp.]|jgi:hypothetical protein|nr:PKD domain-containing protein [Sphingobacterium sp.]